MKKSFGQVVIEAFCDDKGGGSMMRWCMLILVIGGLLIIGLTSKEEYGLAVITLAVTGKIVQKRLSERKSTKE